MSSKDLNDLTMKDLFKMGFIPKEYFDIRDSQSTTIKGKIFIIKYTPKENLGKNVTSCMIFKYREDYENLKIINKMIGKTLPVLFIETKFKFHKFDRDLKELENFVEKFYRKKCKSQNFDYFDYLDGDFYRIKFYNINNFLEEAKDNFLCFEQNEIKSYFFIETLKNINFMLNQLGLIPIGY